MLWIPIDKSSDTPLIRQVYEQIRIRILRGELQAGQQIPSTRELASDLQVSRNVILEAYDQLLVEGYIISCKGSGTYVAEGVLLEEPSIEQPLPLINLFTDSKQDRDDLIDFRSGIPDLNLFPRKKWANLSRQVYDESPSYVFGYNTPEGRLELRRILSSYLLRTRGVRCHPDQLVITTGATQALSLIAKLLLSPGDEVIIEDPITHEIQTIFSSPGASLYPIPVDGHGMRTELIPADKKPSFVFVTPSHQFPIGGILTIRRRIHLIQFAQASGCYIVEDDYDSEFRYKGTPVSSLQGLEPSRVIYIGTFSKILSPGLRLGYLVLPPSLIERCRDLKWFTDLHTPSIEQLILARFIEECYLERHISKMKKIYQKRREILTECLKMNFKDKVKIIGDATGLHLTAEFKDVDFSNDIIDKILEHGVRIYPVEIHTIKKGVHKNRIIMGYGNLTNEQISEGVSRLRNALLSM